MFLKEVLLLIGSERVFGLKTIFHDCLLEKIKFPESNQSHLFFSAAFWSAVGSTDFLLESVIRGRDDFLGVDSFSNSR